MRFYGVDRQTDRFAVQALRATPPGFASENKQRRRVFGAALEQFDQLLVAAETVGPATAPVPLFYALSQAGRAFAAARIPGSQWRPHSHGLSIGDPGRTIGDTVLTPTDARTGSFQLFCQSIGSAVLTGPVTLSAVWAAVGRYRIVDGLGAGYPVAANATILGNIAPGHILLEGAVAARLPDDENKRRAILSDRLSHFSSGGEGIGVAPDRWPNQTFPEPRVEVYWTDQNGELRSASEVLTLRVAKEDSGYVLAPALGDCHDVLHPMAATYATWLALSSLARYHPDAWQRALDRDSAVTAVAIEESIDLSLELFPYSIKELLMYDGRNKPVRASS